MPKKKILLVGPVAPPFGGVSIHISRLANLLSKDFAFDFVDESRVRKKHVFNVRSLNLFKYLQKITSADLVYIHSGKNSLRCLHLVLAKILRKKTVITFHSFKNTSSGFMVNVYRSAFKLANTAILVNNELNVRLLLKGTEFVVKEAFIPPILENELDLPGYILNWFRINKEKNNLIICANASLLETFNSQDLYGLDMCIEVTRRLVNQVLPVKFIFVVGSIEKYKDRYVKSSQLINQLNLNDHFLLVNERLSFVKIIELSDIVLRPTNTDGDALTVREGLFLNKIVLASDVVKRPEGVSVFKNRDINDLELQLKKIIKIHSTQYNTDNKRFVESVEDVKEFYLRLIEENL